MKDIIYQSNRWKNRSIDYSKRKYLSDKKETKSIPIVMKTCFSERKLMKQFGNPFFLRESSFQLTPYFWAIFYHPLFTQILKTRNPLNFRGRGGNFGGIGVLRGFVSLTMFAMEMGKNNYFSYHSNSSKGENILHQKHESFTFELPLIKFSWPEKYKAKKKNK